MLLEEPEAEDFRTRVVTHECVVSGHILLEAIIVLSGRALTDPVARVDRLLDVSGIRQIDFSGDMTRAAQQAFLEFGKGRHAARLNFGDCMSYALARTLSIPLLWKGGDFDLTDVDRLP